MKRITVLLLILVSLFCAAQSAWGRAYISIWPVKLTLWQERKTDEITLENKGKEEVKLQVDAKTWDMDETGKFIEADTGDFVFFPRLISIAPGASVILRVGYKGDFPALEKSYRLYLQELPPVRPPEQPHEDALTSGLHVLLRLSIPLFVRQTREVPSPAPEVELLGVTDKGLRMVVKNTGKNNLGVRNTKVELLAEKGKKVLSTGEHAKFLRVLPERQILLQEVPVDLAQCAKTDSVRVTLSFEESAAAKKSGKNSFEQVLPFTTGCVPIGD
jgi:fimbrial chaperone protein